MSLGRDDLKHYQQSYKKFLEQVDELRPELHRFCRRLSDSVWDAEDLVQETLLRAYGKLGWSYVEVLDLRAYLFRTATNTWLNECRKRGRAERPAESAPEPEASAPRSDEVREAMERMLHLLSPNERLAFVLKDVFAFDMDAIAGQLATSVGTVKSALFRARRKLEAARAKPAPPPRAEAPPTGPEHQKLLDAFVDAFNAHDLDRVIGLMRADATAQVVGMVQELNREQIRKGSMPHTVVESDFAVRRTYLGEELVLIGPRADGSEDLAEVSTVTRITTAGGQIVDTQFYFFCPELVAEVCAELGYTPVENPYFYG